MVTHFRGRYIHLPGHFKVQLLIALVMDPNAKPKILHREIHGVPRGMRLSKSRITGLWVACHLYSLKSWTMYMQTERRECEEHQDEEEKNNERRPPSATSERRDVTVNGNGRGWLGYQGSVNSL